MFQIVPRFISDARCTALPRDETGKVSWRVLRWGAPAAAPRGAARGAGGARPRARDPHRPRVPRETPAAPWPWPLPDARAPTPREICEYVYEHKYHKNKRQKVVQHTRNTERTGNLVAIECVCARSAP